ncbi:helix-turn-helix transcriptional regulator [Enterococcus hulanensis]|uniref:helix-turn-helix domain-containing protein n=1 Tax=Enterococcus hulanensis TaxID=2559929 RepID=UPI00289273B2|nr:helix-turn-helix transcriptional regulator [Enterococcus hulanensis]MDT2661522.1 helix-turn-helix transcriptional regulator [Enterococcus hulanensis]
MNNLKKRMISENLCLLRKQYQYILEEVAERLDVIRQAISKWEMGEIIPTLLNTLLLVDLYDVTNQ